MSCVTRYTLPLHQACTHQERPWRRNALYCGTQGWQSHRVLLWVLRSRHTQSIFFLLCRDTFIVTLGNAITSILAGFAIFSVLGYMSQELGVPVNQVAKAGEAKQRSFLLHPLLLYAEDHCFQMEGT